MFACDIDVVLEHRHVVASRSMAGRVDITLIATLHYAPTHPLKKSRNEREICMGFGICQHWQYLRLVRYPIQIGQLQDISYLRDRNGHREQALPGSTLPQRDLLVRKAGVITRHSGCANCCARIESIILSSTLVSHVGIRTRSNQTYCW
jgi:hypothetical protein